MSLFSPIPNEGRTIDTDLRIAVGIFLLVAVTYGYFFNGGGWNQNAHFDLSRAIVEQQSFAIDDFRENTNDLSFYQGHFFSNKSPGISFLAALPYALATSLESMIGVDSNAPMVMTFNAWICTFSICGLLGALVPVFLFLHARATLGVSQRRALAVALFVALGTPMIAYASMLVLHVPSAALLLISFTISSRSRGASPWLSGLLAGLAGLCNYVAIPAAAVLLAMTVTFDGPRWRRGLAFATAASPSAVLLLLYQRCAFGSFFQTPIASENPLFLDEGAFLGILHLPSIEAAWGITFSRFRGLFYLSPLLLLAIAGAVVVWRTRDRRFEVVAIGAIALIFFGFNVTFNGWHGGAAIGPRYLLPIVPFLGVLMMRVRGIPRSLWFAGAFISFTVNFAATAVDPMPSQRIGDPLGSYVLPLLVTGELPADFPESVFGMRRVALGHVSVNRQTIDEVFPHRKHPPGSLESEWASFNVGELLAPGSLISLVPILVWLSVGVWLLWRRSAA